MGTTNQTPGGKSSFITVCCAKWLSVYADHVLLTVMHSLKQYVQNLCSAQCNKMALGVTLSTAPVVCELR